MLVIVVGILFDASARTANLDWVPTTGIKSFRLLNHGQ